MSKSHEVELREIIAEAKRLRVEYENAEARFFGFLMEVERDRAHVWKAAGCADYEQFLRSYHLVDPSRYRFFAMGADQVGIDLAVEHGAHWTVQRGKMSAANAPKKAIREFEERARAFVEVEKVAPSEQAVREWKNEVLASDRVHSVVRKQDRLHQLESENASLRRELAAAKKKIALLEKRLGAASNEVTVS